MLRKLRRPKISDKEIAKNNTFQKVFLNIWKNKFKNYTERNLFLRHSKYPTITNRITTLLTNKPVNIIHIKKNMEKSKILPITSIVKFIDLDSVGELEFQFLRKNKVYNKGRYSRCRQNYRTGVYMCMYLSIICVFGLYYWFLQFSINFTYLWWLFISFVCSFFLPKFIKYSFYKITIIFNKTFEIFRWF